MKQIFTRVQLVVIWVAGIIISWILFNMPDYDYYGFPYNDLICLIVPIVIVATILVITLSPKKTYK